MSPFTPADGNRARWRAIYDLFAAADVGETITYAAMGAATWLDPDVDRHKIQVAVRRAAQELLKIDLRSIESVPNVGYRLAEASQHLEIAGRYQAKARRAVRRGSDQVVYVNMDELDETTRNLFLAAAAKFQEQAEAIQRLDVRQRRHEKQLAAAVTAQAETSAQISDLAARLASLEREQATAAGAELPEPEGGSKT